MLFISIDNKIDIHSLVNVELVNILEYNFIALKYKNH